MSERERFAKTLTPLAAKLSVSALNDRLRESLEAMADDMECQQSPEQELEESADKDPRGALDRIAAAHASMRLDSGFDLERTIAEYDALRSTILRVWSKNEPGLEERGVDEIVRFDGAITEPLLT